MIIDGEKVTTQSLIALLKNRKFTIDFGDNNLFTNSFQMADYDELNKSISITTKLTVGEHVELLDLMMKNMTSGSSVTKVDEISIDISSCQSEGNKNMIHTSTTKYNNCTLCVFIADTVDVMTIVKLKFKYDTKSSYESYREI